MGTVGTVDTVGSTQGAIGIDAGATLWKLCFEGSETRLEVLPAGDLASLGERLDHWRPQRVCVTGGGAVQIEAALNGRDVRHVPEFEAWARGAPLLAERAGVKLPPRYLLVSLGTGTSVLLVNGGTTRRVAGTALGGGTLLGLGRLLTGADSFDELARLADRGDRRNVDLLVGDIYPKGGIALHPDLNASSFAKLDSRDPADLAHAVVGLLGENIGIICAVVAQSAAIETIVYAGNTLTGNPALREVLEMVSLGLGHRPEFLPDGAFCGAVGASAVD
jgi:type II pantothenate kinase